MIKLLHFNILFYLIFIIIIVETSCTSSHQPLKGLSPAQREDVVILPAAPQQSSDFKTLALSCTENVFAEGYDIDDRGYVSVNGFEHKFSYGRTVKRLDITPYLNDGENTITYSLYNDKGGYAYGFRLIHDGKTIYEASKLANGWGGVNTYLFGRVYLHVQKSSFCLPKPSPSPIWSRGRIWDRPQAPEGAFGAEVCQEYTTFSGKKQQSCFRCPAGSSHRFKNGVAVGCQQGNVPGSFNILGFNSHRLVGGMCESVDY